LQKILAPKVSLSTFVVKLNWFQGDQRAILNFTPGPQG
jgi:hypothetical protein